MYHPRFKGSPYQMGQKMGNIFKKSNARFPVRLDSFQMKFGRESGRLLKRFFPEAAEEIRGITDVLGINNGWFTSWMMCMGCCLYNLDEGSCIEERGCTAFSFVRHGRVYHGRDNDLLPFLKKVSKSVYYEPENKRRFILNTSSFINGEEGINDSGLVAAMTFVLPKLAEIRPGINSVFLVRYLLENYKTVDEALAALEKLPIASSCNIILTDESGKMVVAECHPLRRHLREPEKNSHGEPFVITVNHFTSREMQVYEAGDHNAYSSEIRYQTAYHALKEMEYDDGLEHAENILSGRYGFMCQYERKLNFDTVWSSVFDISRHRIYRAEGNPKNTGYREDLRLH